MSTPDTAQPKQRWLKGRVPIEPTVRLADYKIKASIDYLIFDADLKRPTQFRYVQDEIEPLMGRRLSVEPLDSNLSRCHLFRVRINDPDKDNLEAISAGLAAKYGLESELRLAKMELCVDFIPKDASTQKGVAMLKALVRHFMPGANTVKGYGGPCYYDPARARMMIVRTKHANYRLLGDEFNPIEFPEGVTVYYGAKDAPVRWKAYYKTVDEVVNGVPMVQLPQKERRARIEVTLSGESLQELGLNTLSDLYRFKFEGLRKPYFGFMMPTITDTSKEAGVLKLVGDFQNNVIQKRFKAAGVWGVRERYNEKPWIKGLQRKGNNVAWKTMNEKIKEALRGLTYRYRG